MKNIFKISIILLGILVFCSCEKTISIKQQSYTSKLSIQGLITPHQFPQIYINRTVPYFDPKINTRDLTVDKAFVSLNDGINSVQLKFDSSFNLHYCRYDYFYTSTVPIQSNKTYTLLVVFEGINYTANATTSQVKVPINSTDYIPNFKDIYGEHEGVVIKYTDKPGEGDYYRYQMGRLIDSSVKSVDGVNSKCTGGDKYYVKEIGRVIYSDKNLDGQNLSFAFEPAYDHKKNDQGYLALQTVDKNIFNFYDNLEKQKLAEYNPFVEPVFIIPGQFGDKAIGVFGAYVVSDSTLFTFPE